MAIALSSDWTEDDLSRQVVLALGFARGVLDDIESAADSPLGRIAQKVGEEGLELALAAVAPRDDKVVAEAADLIFHMLVLLKSRGLPLARVVAELAARHTR